MLTLDDLMNIEWMGLLQKAGVVVLLVVVIGLALHIVWRALAYLHLIRRKTILYELTPPAFNDKYIQATESFFNALHGTIASRTIVDRVLNRQLAYEARIASTRKQGIRFYVKVPELHTETFEALAYSYLPDVKLNQADEHLSSHSISKARLLEFKLANSYALPLKSYDELAAHDPVGYLTSAMTKLKDNEQAVFQLVFMPKNVPDAKKLAKKVLRNDAVLTSLTSNSIGNFSIMNIISSVLMGIVDIVSIIQDHGQTRSYGARAKTREFEQQMQVAKGKQPARSISGFEQQDVEPIHEKLSGQLFEVSIRVLIATDSKKTRRSKRSAIIAALNLYTTKYQSLKPNRRAFGLSKKWLLFKIQRGLPTIRSAKPNYLSSAELATLYHFPNSISARTEDVVHSLTKTLQAPLSLKDGRKLDILLGENKHQNTVTPIGLTTDERRRHMFIVGGTGNGKTTMIKYQVVQDILAGRGVAVLDPHGDLSEELLRYIPEERIKDVIYFNPSDIAYPMGLNLLELPKELTGDDRLIARDFLTETIISIFRKTFSDDATGGHRIEHNLRNAILTAMTVEGATLFTVLDLLTDKDYRKPIVEKLEQDWLKKFWTNEFGKGSAWQQVKAMGGITAKISRYHASESADRILSQPESTINFDDILDGKILICNLAKGLIGEDTSEVLGISILAQLQLAGYRRIKQSEQTRKPFYIYVDEFQNFATTSFVEMLSEARKYRLYLTMAEQSTQQQSDQQIVQVIMNNIGTLVSFRTGSVADERILRPSLGNRYIDEGELLNLPAYNFYARIVGEEAKEPMSGETVVLDDDGDAETAERAKQSSRKLYATKYKPPKPKRTGQKPAQTTSKAKKAQKQGYVPSKKGRKK